MLELTLTQREIFLEGKLLGEVVNNIGGYQRYPFALDVERFERARKHVLLGSDAYAMRFAEQEGRYLISARSPEVDRLPILDVSGSVDATGTAHAWIQARFQMPFSDPSEQVFEDALIRIADGEYWYYAKAHHLMMDGWGFALQMQRLIHVYVEDGRQGTGHPEHWPSFGEYVQRQAAYAEGSRYVDDRTYWLERFGYSPEPLFKGSVGPASARTSATIDNAMNTAVSALATGLRVPVAAVYYAAMFVYFSRVHGVDDLVICSPVHNRRNAQDKDTLGSFVNVIAHRFDRPDDPTFSGLVRYVARSLANDHRHGRFPLGELVRQVRQEGGAEGVFQDLAFNYQKLGFELCVDDHAVETHYLSHGHERAALTFVLCDYGSSQPTRLHLDYSNERFGAREAEALLTRFVYLLGHVSAEPDTDIAAFPLLTDEEWSEQRDTLSGQLAALREDVCLHEFFEDQAERSPERVAVECNGSTLSYRDLEERSNRLANVLIDMGAGPGTFVGVCHGRTLELPVALLAVLKSGAAYVPLDPAYPADRIRYILDDAAVRIVLIDETGRAALPTDVHLMVVDARQMTTPIDDVSSAEPPGRIRMGLRDHDLAYVIYTSGSTGNPKGVLIEHRQAAAFVQWALAAYDRDHLEAVLASTSICFDLSIFEIFVTLAAGGRTVIVETILALQHGGFEGLSLINTVPSGIRALLSVDAVPSSIRCINLAGEPLRQDLVDRLHDGRTIKVYDLYGPSEATTYSTRAPRTPGGDETIGWPITNTAVYILDKAGHPLPRGATGELYIGGCGLARGYLGRDDLTKARFAVSAHVGERLYRTGDKARFREDGSLQYLGRDDSQVKLRGYRIELGEIETVLTSHPDVAECAVVVRDDIVGADHRTLVAYVVARNATTVDGGKLASWLATKLMAPMVPAIYMSLPSLPLTPNGKLDRKALPVPDAVHRGAPGFVAPASAHEHVVCTAWESLLGIRPVGTRDNFFALGGDSLLLMRLSAELSARFSIRLHPSELFASTTAAAQAALLDRHVQTTALLDRVMAIETADRGDFIDI
jgi:amino acid adenylation domain-containing protein